MLLVNHIADGKLAWSSSLAGALTTGADVWVSLKEGKHTITLTATDDLGFSAQASISINVQPGADFPTVQILSPQDNASFGIDDTIDFNGQGTDPLEGILAGSSLQWISDKDGFLGKGNSIKVKLTGNKKAPVYHKITLIGTNKAGKQASISITVLVGMVG